MAWELFFSHRHKDKILNMGEDMWWWTTLLTIELYRKYLKRLSRQQTLFSSLQVLLFGLASTVSILYWLLYFQGVLWYDQQATEGLKANFNTWKSSILWQIIYTLLSKPNIKSKNLHITYIYSAFWQISWSLNLCNSMLHDRRLYTCVFLRMYMF